jgi:hypothetical protein
MAMVPGSKGTITDPKFGTLTVKVTDMSEDEDGGFTVLVEEWAPSIGRSSDATAEPATNTPKNTEVPANAVNTPLIFEPPSTLAGVTPQVWMAVSAGPSGAYDPNWGGCFVHLSTDNASFAEVGEIDAPARMGVLTTSLAAYGGSNPDTVHSFGVNLTESNGDLSSVTATDAANFVSGCAIQDTAGGVVEFTSFQDATLTSAHNYTLGTKLYRGLYSSTAGSHSSGALFARLDDQIFKLTLPPQFIGQTLYIKLQSFNVYGGGLQDLSTCTVYTYTPRGTGYGGGTGGVPTTPTGLTATPQANFNALSWTANPSSDNVDHYDVYRANGLSASFGSASLIGSSPATNYMDLTITGGAAYTYFIKAVNSLGSSSNSTGANCTSAASTGVLRWYGGTDGRQPDAGEILFEIEMVGGENFASGLPSNVGGCDVAPTGSVTLPIKVNGSTVGHADIAAGTTTMTWTMASSYTAAAHDKLKFEAPATQDATLAGLFYTWVGGR